MWFELLKKIVFAVSPHLGGRNRGVVNLIESFTPEGSEKVSECFQRGQDLCNDAKLQQAPNTNLNRLAQRWVEGLCKDQRCVLCLTTALSQTLCHQVGPDKMKCIPFGISHVHQTQLIDGGAPKEIHLLSVEGVIGSRVAAAMTHLAYDPSQVPPQVAQSRFTRLPSPAD